METNSIPDTQRLLQKLQYTYPDLNTYLVPTIENIADSTASLQQYEQVEDIFQNVTLKDILEDQPHLIKFYVLISLIRKSNSQRF
jgi:hypothetical protein